MGVVGVRAGDVSVVVGVVMDVVRVVGVVGVVRVGGMVAWMCGCRW